MNIGKFIKEHEPLNELPYIIVFETIIALKELGLLKDDGEIKDVETL